MLSKPIESPFLFNEKILISLDMNLLKDIINSLNKGEFLPFWMLFETMKYKYINAKNDDERKDIALTYILR